MRNVKIAAQTGLTIGYAQVVGTNVVIQAADGQAITKAAGADVVMK